MITLLWRISTSASLTPKIKECYARCFRLPTAIGWSHPAQLNIWGTTFRRFTKRADKRAIFAIVGVSAAEASSEWPCGYYRVDADLVELNTQLLAL